MEDAQIQLIVSLAIFAELGNGLVHFWPKIIVVDARVLFDAPALQDTTHELWDQITRRLNLQ